MKLRTAGLIELLKSLGNTEHHFPFWFQRWLCFSGTTWNSHWKLSLCLPSLVWDLHVFDDTIDTVQFPHFWPGYASARLFFFCWVLLLGFFLHLQNLLLYIFCLINIIIFPLSMWEGLMQQPLCFAFTFNLQDTNLLSLFSAFTLAISALRIFHFHINTPFSIHHQQYFTA